MKSTTLVSALILLLAHMALAGGGPADVLVVVNGADPESVAVGEHFRAARAVPKRNVCVLDAPTALVTDLATYKSRIETPVRDHLLRKGLLGRVDYIVCARGIPILVRVGGGPVSTAAILQVMDTDLSGRDRGLPTLRNPYLHGSEAFSYTRAYGGRHLYLVNFLTGYTAADAKALVDRAIEAEKAPPKAPAFYFQDAKGNARSRNVKYPGVTEAMKEKGFGATHVKVGGDEVVDRADVMVWMSGGSYSGLKEKGIASNTYLPGALVDMLESFGAVPRNFDPDGKPSQVPVTWFVRHGVTGIHGAVAEPFAHTFPDTSLPLRYVDGFNLAEAFHGSLPFLYWQNLVIGDPLCTPFARRPVVKLDGLADRALEGVVDLVVSTEGETAAVEALVDGRPLGRLKGDSGRLKLDTRRLRNGPHTLLVVAHGPRPHAVAGWLERVLEVKNDDLFVVDCRIVGGNVRCFLNRAVGRGESVALAVSAPSGELEGKTETGRDGTDVTFVPETSLPRGVEIRVVPSGAGPGEVTLLTPPASLRVDGPAEAKAGEEIEVVVTALDDAGQPVTGRTGHYALRSSTPDALLAEGAGPVLKTRVTLTRAGEIAVSARDRLGDLTAVAKVRVTAAEFAEFDMRSKRRAVCGVPFDLHVRAMDRFRNVVTDWTGTLKLVSAGGGVLGTITLGPDDRGQGTIADVRIDREGRQVIGLVDGSGKTVGRTQLDVRPSRILSWLVLGPVASPSGRTEATLDEDLLDGESEVVAAKGSVHAGRVWREFNAPKEPVDLARVVSGKSDAVIYALCWVELSTVPDGARIRITRGPAMAVFLNGERIFSEAKAQARGKKVSSLVESPPLIPGWNRIMVKAVRKKGRCAFNLELLDGSETAIPVLGARLSPPEGLTRFGLSGSVVCGKAGLAGLKVVLEGPRKEEATTDASGGFAFGGLAPGVYRVRPGGGGLTIDPPEREITIEKESAEGVSFTAEDRQPPTVSIVSPKRNARLSRWIEVALTVSDNVAVEGVQLEVDGKPVGKVVKKAPFTIRVDANPIGSGTRTLRVVARDTSGNTAKSEPVKVKLDLDLKKPSIKVIQPRKGRTVVGNYMTVEVIVRDNRDVAVVDLFVDGKRLGKPFKGVTEIKERFKIGGGKKRELKLLVRATDTSGNVAEVEVPFKKR
jgi:uncharacterized protein (TIGR03790 family)